MPNLVGIGLSQVPTNSMLGGMAYQDPEHASIKNLDLKNLSQINSEIADTAVDVFVYDTRKDSDGGAWRKRTQNTSWYNETLGTATRGTRREFPAVAVIVSTTTKVTIYDGDDPNLPMWMVFNAGQNGFNNSTLLQYSGQNGYHLAALNGILVIGEDTNSDNWGSPIINFISEYIVRMDPQSSEGGIFNGGVAQRNDTVGFNSPGQIIIINSIIKDVAMTVLPNAPIDDTTGLPVPTIAVATNGGISVIRDDGNVFDITGQLNAPYRITFNRSNPNEIITSGYWTRVMKVYKIPSKDANESTQLRYYVDSQAPKIPFGSGAMDFESTQNEELIVKVSGGTPSNGFYRIAENLESKTNGMTAYIRSDCNTGWMHGDIKGAFLSDTDTTNAVAVYYDNFSNNDKGWGFVNTSISGGNMVITQQSQARSTDPDALSGVATGTKLVFTFTVSGSGTGDVVFDDDGAGAGVGGNTNYGSFSSTGSYTFTATKTASNRIRIMRNNGSNDYNINFLNITTEYDRSIKNKGLGVYGTITKTPVATGADLVGYSFNSSNSNYLEQPYNSDLDFGTGAFSITAWLKIDNDNTCIAVDKSIQNGTQTNRFVLYYDGSTNNFRLYDSAGTVNSSAVELNRWYHVVVVKEGNGGGKIYINGKLDGTSSTLTANNSNTGHKLVIGNGYDYSYAWRGSIALVRISGSVPSAEQVKKMYEDEKCLFHENAKATLYGSSDAVTGLAFDDTTNVLHVGTSAGRSEFQGLRRINNTTTAVTTAISVSNGLVAEQ